MVDAKHPIEPLNAAQSEKDNTAKNIRWLAGKALSGFLFSIFFVSALLIFNIANLRDLIFASDDKWIALFILTFFLGLTFASIQMGIAIWSRFSKDDDDNDKPGRGPKMPDIEALITRLFAPAPQPQPIKVKARRFY
ncbi:hypothetical protein [Hirschia maritima]|uniref:hypothetical protein n=1 Tax=Hirschia maritima TaxID=1121961 RepID=UPI0003720862|nr:hypothetical protein [Hirschia maritima]